MADSVFVVQHACEHSDGTEDRRLVGVYTDRSLAEEAVARLRMQPGFRDFPDGFRIDACDLDGSRWEEGFVEGKPTASWVVWRQDEVGNRFEVSRGHNRQEAFRLVADYESRGHKQHYWASPAR